MQKQEPHVQDQIWKTDHVILVMIVQGAQTGEYNNRDEKEEKQLV